MIRILESIITCIVVSILLSHALSLGENIPKSPYYAVCVLLIVIAVFIESIRSSSEDKKAIENDAKALKDELSKANENRSALKQRLNAEKATNDDLKKQLLVSEFLLFSTRTQKQRDEVINEVIAKRLENHY